MESKQSDKQVHLSRQFCRELIDQSENKNAVLNQIFKLFEIDPHLLENMNTWSLEKTFWEETPKTLSKEAINTYYVQAWQKAKSFSKQIRLLIDALEKSTNSLAGLNYNQDCQKAYYQETIKPIYGVCNFKEDLQNILFFLDNLPKNELVKFHYF